MSKRQYGGRRQRMFLLKPLFYQNSGDRRWLLPDDLHDLKFAFRQSLDHFHILIPSFFYCCRIIILYTCRRVNTFSKTSAFPLFFFHPPITFSSYNENALLLPRIPGSEPKPPPPVHKGSILIGFPDARNLKSISNIQKTIAHPNSTAWQPGTGSHSPN